MRIAADKCVELQLEKPAHGGDCVARHEGKVYFVRYGLPGEKVIAEIVKEQKKIAFAQVKQVLEGSSWRRENPWQEAGYGGVGAAELAHVDPLYQRYWKAQVLAESFSRIGGRGLWHEFERLFPQWEADPVGNSGALEMGAGLIKPAPADECVDGGWGWRLRLDFMVGENGLPLMKGYRSERSYAVRSMPLARPVMMETEIFTNPQKWAGCYRPGDHIRIWDSARGVRVCVEDRIYDGQAQRLDEAEIVQQVSGYGEFRLNPWGFWQPHFQAAEVLAQAVAEIVDSESSSVLELYAGAGLFTSVLAEKCAAAQIATIEGYEPAVAAAQQKFAKESAERDLRILAGRIDTKKVAQLRGERYYDTVLLDPPRAGAGQGIMRELVAAEPSRIIYIACDIASLARDLAVLVERDYQLDYLQGFDLFPNTHHVEVVGLLVREG